MSKYEARKQRMQDPTYRAAYYERRKAWRKKTGWTSGRNNKRERDRNADPLGYYDRRAQKIYGLEPGEYTALHQAQGSRCPICELEVEVLLVDHDHSTGKIRGLLCRTCNLGIGYLNDDLRFLRKAIAYLEEHHEGNL